MKKLFDVFRVANEGRNLLYNLVPRRGARYQENIKWVKPEKKPIYHRDRSGDLVTFPEIKPDTIYLPFKDSKELQTADEKVKKMFSLRYQLPKSEFEVYTHELVERVKSHALDNNSVEVTIAKDTAKIRYYRKLIMDKPKKNYLIKKIIRLLIQKRKKNLKLLRLKDYKKFEWLLEKLDLEFKPAVPVLDQKVTRKKSIMRLAKLKVEQVKEQRLAALKKTLDEQKIPFLEKKIQKLKEIKEKEEKYGLPPTVKEEDIQECIKKIEKVKIDLEERSKRGYVRKIHPYFLEPFEENLLWEKEKAGEFIREKQELEAEKKAS